MSEEMREKEGRASRTERDAALLGVAARGFALVIRTAVIVGIVAALSLGGMWAAKRWLRWNPPSPWADLFSEHVQRAEALLYVYDRDTGWKPNPYTQLQHVSRGPFQRGEPQDARLRTNSEGFFDREHYPATDYYRIAFLGDSWVEAQQVDPSQRFTDLVEGYLHAATKGEKAVETMNFGVSNLGTAQEYGVLRAHVAKYRPDEIWVVFNANDDILDSSPLTTGPPLGPTFVQASSAAGAEITDIRFGFPDPPPVAEALRRQRYGEWISLTGAQLRPYLFAAETHPAFDTMLAETRAALRLMKRAASGVGATLVLLYLPSKPELDRAEWQAFVTKARTATGRELHLDAGLGERRMESIARDEGLRFLSLKPLMLEKGNDQMLQGHLSRMGHHWVADWIARRLLAEGCCARPQSAAGGRP
jgi:hypothetical protein